MGLREWMIVVGGLLILAVIGDGVRRMYQDRKNSIRYSRRARNVLPDDDFEALQRNPELPTGEVRVVSRGDFNLPPLQDDEDEPDRGHSVPVLMEQVGRRDPPAVSTSTPEEIPGGLEDLLPSQEELFGSSDDSDDAEGADSTAEVADVIIINVKARSGFTIPGKRLLENLLACDIRFGDMDIFHRYDGGKKGRRTLFSIANLVEPGTFDVDNMDDFSTPGICMFMRLPGPPEPQEAFRLMLETARILSEQLDADLYDDQHCKLRQQSLEHLRERIIEFERKRLTRS